MFHGSSNLSSIQNVEKVNVLFKSKSMKTSLETIFKISYEAKFAKYNFFGTCLTRLSS